MVVSTETVAVLIFLCGSRTMKSTPQIRDADETMAKECMCNRQIQFTFAKFELLGEREVMQQSV
jgi:hypothetical protein